MVSETFGEEGEVEVPKAEFLHFNNKKIRA